MDRTRLLKLVNPVLFLSLVLQAATGAALATGILSSWPKAIEPVAELHEYNGYVFVALALFHLWLNWGWVKAQFFRKQ